MQPSHLLGLGLPLVGSFPSGAAPGPPEATGPGPAVSSAPARASPGPRKEEPVVARPAVDERSQRLAAHMRRPMAAADTERQVSVVSFNMLLKGFDQKPYYPSVGPELRAWPWRKEQLQKLLLSVDADVYCMQEVECGTFPEEMLAWLSEAGYAAAAPMDDSKGKYPDMAKAAIFYKSARFESLWQDHRSRVVLAALRHSASGRLLYVASCHLEGAPWEAAKRFTQCKKALESVARHQKSAGVDPTACALVFAGDFNEGDDGAVCKCLVEGGLPKGFRVPSLPEEEITKADFAHPFRLTDLYALAPCRKRWPSRPATLCPPPEESAAWGNSVSFGAVDFMFYSHSALQPVAVREPFSQEQLEATAVNGIPCLWHFSDHVPIGGVFNFVDNGERSVNGAEVSIN